MSATTPKSTTVTRTFYKDDPSGGERLERAVYSEADAVNARFDGYFPDAEPAPAPAAKAANKPAGNNPSSANS
jgi:hypothetical protein